MTARCEILSLSKGPSPPDAAGRMGEFRVTPRPSFANDSHAATLVRLEHQRTGRRPFAFFLWRYPAFAGGGFVVPAPPHFFGAQMGKWQSALKLTDGGVMAQRPLHPHAKWRGGPPPHLPFDKLRENGEDQGSQ